MKCDICGKEYPNDIDELWRLFQEGKIVVKFYGKAKNLIKNGRLQITNVRCVECDKKQLKTRLYYPRTSKWIAY